MCKSVVLTELYRHGPGADGSQRTWIESCSAKCSCSGDEVGVQLEPVCINDGRRYYSPCHAGCTRLQQTAAGQIVSLSAPSCLLALSVGVQSEFFISPLPNYSDSMKSG